MASATLPVEARPGILVPALPFLVAAALYVLLLLAGGSLLNDADTYWHIAVGNWVFANGLPHTDPFSFTFAGSPWIAKEWLSQIAFAKAYAIGGWTGVVVLTAAALALAFGLLTQALGQRLAPLPTLALVAVAFMLVAPHATARPHVLALPVMVAWVAGLARASDRDRAPPFALILLMVLWANLHAGFTFGILLVGAFGLDAVASSRTGARVRVASAWIAFGLATLAAGCATPYGPQSILATVKVLGIGPALSVIGEWKPADFGTFGPLEFALALAAGLALWRGVTLPPVRILILLGLAHLALSADRNAELLGLVAPLVMAGPLVRQFPQLAGQIRLPSLGQSAIVAAILVCATVVFAASASYEPSSANTPAAAVAALRQAGAQRVLNDYNLGGYLVYAGVPTFIDGRTELFGRDFLLGYTSAVSLNDIPGFLKLLDDRDIDATMLLPSTPAVGLLDRLPGWKRAYADGTAVVHVRLSLRGSLK